MAMISSRFQRAQRWLKNHIIPHTIILVYHRIVELPNDPYLLSVKPGNFKDQMQVVREQFNPISLHQLIKEIQEKKHSRGTVVVTFDDGYADNLYHAQPVLEQFDIPATVFVTAGYLATQREFWWDELERLVLQSKKIPNCLDMVIGDHRFHWDAGGASEELLEAVPNVQGWNIEQEVNPNPRYQLLRKVYHLVHSLPIRERDRILDELLSWTGAEPGVRATHRCMTAEEVAILVKGTVVDVGAHTMFHTDLASLPPVEQSREIQQSKKALELIVGHPVLSFAYPYGSATSETISILQENDFECACATHASAVWPGVDPFRLPRLGVGDWGRHEFTHWLKWWMQG